MHDKGRLPSTILIHQLLWIGGKELRMACLGCPLIPDLPSPDLRVPDLCYTIFYYVEGTQEGKSASLQRARGADARGRVKSGARACSLSERHL